MSSHRTFSPMIEYFDRLFETLLSPTCPAQFIQRVGDIDFNPFQSDIDQLCKEIREKCLRSPCLLDVPGGVNICGDIHGQFCDLLLLFQRGKVPSKTNQYLFLGDYVDRGKQSLETILFLYYLKSKYPDYIHLLRGNHECSSITKLYGFFDECKRRLRNGIKVWKTITDSFNALPVAALVGGKIFCIHGGLSPELHDLSQINMIMRPTDVLDTGLMCDLLWSDPSSDKEGWDINERGVSYTFGRDVVDDFCNRFDIDLICRAHQVVEDGYEFFADKKLVTVFSAPNYAGDFTNSAAMVSVSEDLTCSIVKMSYSAPSNSNGRASASTRSVIEGKSGSKVLGSSGGYSSYPATNPSYSGGSTYSGSTYGGSGTSYASATTYTPTVQTTTRRTTTTATTYNNDYYASHHFPASNYHHY